MKIKKILLITLCTVAVLAFGAFSAMAAEHAVTVDGVEYTITMPDDYTPAANVVQYGHCGIYEALDEGEENQGNDMYWELIPNDDTVTINNEPLTGLTLNVWGDGDTMYNMQPNGDGVGWDAGNKAKWGAYYKQITRATVADNVVTLNNGAFVAIPNLHTVMIGKNTTTFKHAAFESCTNLKTIYRNGNEPVVGTFDLSELKSLGSYLFDGCRYVENIILPTEGSYSLNTEFLKTNHKLKEIYIPKACKSVEILAFRNCSALENVYFEGETVVKEAQTLKEHKDEGGFYAYAFHNSGVGSNSARSLSISALPGTSAYEYAIRNASVTYEKEPTGLVQTISYIEPYTITAYDDDDKVAFTDKVVQGFSIDSEFIHDNTTYVLFDDADFTNLFGGMIVTSDRNIYVKRLLDFIGYMVRIRDYHGLRAMYEYDTSTFEGMTNYEVIEVGTLGKKLYGIDPVLTVDYPAVSKAVIYQNGVLIGKLAEPENAKGIATIASTTVGFEDEGALMKSRIGSEMIYRAYVTIKEKNTDELYTFYSVQGRMDLTKACKATAMYGADLSDSANSFIKQITDLNVDINYIYTKAEAIAHLTEIYNTSNAILSGQHISSSATTVRDTLNSIINKTGEMPAVLGYDLGDASRQGGYGEDFNDNVATEFIEYARQGGLITMSAHMTNPLTNSGYRRPYLSEAGWNALMDASFWSTLIDTTEGNGAIIAEEAAYIEGLETPIVLITDEEKAANPGYTTGSLYYPSLASGATAVTDDQATLLRYRWIQQLEDYARIFQRFEDAGVTVFFRPFHETNGAWFWFNGASMVGSDTPARFRTLWEYVYKYFTYEKGLTNLVWIFSPNLATDGSNSGTTDVMKFYPGDDYVDVMGLDWYEGGNTPNTANGEVTGRDMIFEYPSLIDPDNSSKYGTVWERLAGTYTRPTFPASLVDKLKNFPIAGKQMPVVYGEFGPGTNLRNADPALSYNGEDLLKLVKDVAADGKNFGWILLWNGWTGNPLSIQMMEKGYVFMQSDYDPAVADSFEVLTLDESRTLILDSHYGQ